ncbi:MAG: hypothetical protein ACRCT1_22785 [Microcoleaceae cyanobacterium]
MKYLLYFSLELKKEGSDIVYDQEKFAEEPIAISVPDVVSIFESFIASFEEVGIFEKSSPTTIQNREKNATDHADVREPLSEQKSINTSSTLKGLSGKAYICQSKELDEKILHEFCTRLTEYLQICCSQFSPDTFLLPENGLYISGMREVIELRNYLAKYTRSSKKIYQQGYLYIMVI